MWEYDLEGGEFTAESHDWGSWDNWALDDVGMSEDIFADSFTDWESGDPYYEFDYGEFEYGADFFPAIDAVEWEYETAPAELPPVVDWDEYYGDSVPSISVEETWPDLVAGATGSNGISPSNILSTALQVLRAASGVGNPWSTGTVLQQPIRLPNGQVIPAGSTRLPNGQIRLPNGQIIGNPGASTQWGINQPSTQAIRLPDGRAVPAGSIRRADGSIQLPNGQIIQPGSDWKQYLPWIAGGAAALLIGGAILKRR